MSTQRDIEFLYELGSLRNVPRGWRQHIGLDVASVLEHTYRVIWLSLVIARMEGVKSEEKILKMAMIHDGAEARVSDHSIVQKVYVKADEKTASHDMLDATIFEDYEQILDEYEQRQSIEAKIVKDADNLDIDLELKELTEMGSQMPKKFAWNRILVRKEKLYTESARQIWDEIQNSDPSSWLMKKNKFITDKNAGK